MEFGAATANTGQSGRTTAQLTCVNYKMYFYFWIVLLTKSGFLQFFTDSSSPTVTLVKKAYSSVKNQATGVPDTSPLRKRKLQSISPLKNTNLESASSVPETSPLKKKKRESALDTSLPKKRKIEKHLGASQLKLDDELVKNDLDIECVTKNMKLQDLVLDQKLAKEKIQTTGK